MKIRICKSCGTENPLTHIECCACMGDISGVRPIERSTNIETTEPNVPHRLFDLAASAGDLARNPVKLATALRWAAREGDLEAFTSFLNAGADVNAKDEDGWTPLMYAVSNNNREIVVALLNAGADVNAKHKDGVTALMAAKTPGVITALLNTGADIHATDINGVTALMVAARSSENPEVIAALLKGGADIHAKCNKGITVLAYAAANSNSGAISVLLKSGADINAKCWGGVTALMLAVLNENPEVTIAALLNGGADATIKDDSGKRAIDSAEKLKGTEAYQKLAAASKRQYGLMLGSYATLY